MECSKDLVNESKLAHDSNNISKWRRPHLNQC